MSLNSRMILERTVEYVVKSRICLIPYVKIVYYSIIINLFSADRKTMSLCRHMWQESIQLINNLNCAYEDIFRECN